MISRETFITVLQLIREQEEINDKVNLPEDRQDELLQYCEWQPLKEVQLVRKRKKKSAPEGR